jgi:outer membrane lipoprotein SlyB
VLGHQVGNGRGKDAATVLGAVGGAYAGHQVEKSQRKSVSYEVSVRMDDGTRQTIHLKEQPAWREGDRVRLVDGALVSAGQAY